MSDESIAWLRSQIEGDLKAATIISDGGFAPERWDTEPPGQVNPAELPQAGAITRLLDADADDPAFPRREFWTGLHVWERENDEREDQRVRESDLPAVIVNNGRRQADHIVRHDPRNVVADCESKLTILEEHQPRRCPHQAGKQLLCSSCGVDDGWYDCPWPCRTVVALAAAYRHRDGYKQRWGDLERA